MLVEDSAAALRTVGAYIDLNAVRAGVVEDPKDYRWSGYGEAAGGSRGGGVGVGGGGEKGYALFVHLAGKHAETVEQVAAADRRYLYVSGGRVGEGEGAYAGGDRGSGEGGGGGGEAFDGTSLLRLPLALQCHKGAVIGTKAFVE